MGGWVRALNSSEGERGGGGGGGGGCLNGGVRLGGAGQAAVAQVGEVVPARPGRPAPVKCRSNVGQTGQMLVKCRSSAGQMPVKC